MAFKIFRSNLIERTGGNACGGYAQFFGLAKNFLALDSKLLRDVVNPNGHKIFYRAGRRTTVSSCVDNARMVFHRTHNSSNNTGFTDFEGSTGRFSLRSFHDAGGFVTNFQHLRQIAHLGLKQVFKARQSVLNQRIGVFLTDA